MITGRKPKPRALKVLHNADKRFFNDREPQHPSIDPAVPAQLTDSEAIAEWQRVIGTLSHGHVTTVDRATLIGYCLKWGQWVALEAEAKQHPFIVKGVNNGPMPNPAISLANRVLVIMLRAAVELGITPSSRSRIITSGTDQPDPQDEFSAFQRRRRRF